MTKHRRFDEDEIVRALKEARTGVSIDDLCRRLGVSQPPLPFTEDEIVEALKEAGTGVPIADLYRRLGVSQPPPSPLFFRTLHKGLRSYLDGKPSARFWLLVASVFLFVFGVIAYVSLSILESRVHIPLMGIALLLLVSIASLCGALVSILSYGHTGAAGAEAARLLCTIEEKQLGNELGVLKDGDAAPLTIARLNLNQIQEYYAINKEQARKSFAFSVIAISTGLLTLVAGVVLLYEKRIEVATLSGVTGLFLQLIGALNFFLYRKSLEQLKHFYGRLSAIHNAILALKLCEGFVVTPGELSNMEIPAPRIPEMIQKGYDAAFRMRELIIQALLVPPELKADQTARPAGTQSRSRLRGKRSSTSPTEQPSKS